jgi:acyl carrier protein
MKTNEQILKDICEIFSEVLDTDDIVLRPATVASDVPEWDSLAHVRLMIAVGQAFKVKFSAAEVTKLNNVGDLVELVQKKLAKSDSGSATGG